MAESEAERECASLLGEAATALHLALAKAQAAGYGGQFMSALSGVINDLAAVEEMLR